MPEGEGAAGEGLFVPPGHYHSPIVCWEEVEADARSVFGRHPLEVPGVDLRLDEQLALLEELAKYSDELCFPKAPTPGHRYYYENGGYSYGDAIFLYAMLRHLRPRRLVEVGSGYSSAATLDTNERFLDFEVRCTFVDPSPGLLRSLLKPGDLERVEVVEARVQDVDLGLFAQLDWNDVLFVDSSHVSKTGSDVNFLVFEVLPRLRPGVVVHFHDVFAGFEYPREWVRQGRSWNEAYLLRAFLQYNRCFRVLLHNNLLWHLRPEVVEGSFPLVAENPGASLWIERVD
ncbi:MAG TPA: class I SAM-dependent methyltransferase [Acidimicrobiales bacterium]|nr:class I SAM-dependent methyltransferase [Acidimicrobiales bacterium]